MTLFELAGEEELLVPPEPDPGDPKCADTDCLLQMLRDRYAAVSPGNRPRYVLGFEVRNKAGFSATRSCDAIAMDTWESGPLRLIGHEVKASRADWLRELKDPTKAATFIAHVAEWWIVAPRTIVHPVEVPKGWGWLAPAGAKLRTVIPAERRPQPEIPLGLLASLLRSVHGAGRAELERARRPKPHTKETMPHSGTYESYPYHARREDGRWQGDIRPARHELRRIL